MPFTIWNCVLSYKQNNYFSEKQLALPRNYFHNRFPGSKFLLPTFLTGQSGFSGGNLLFATVNFELCLSILGLGIQGHLHVFLPLLQSETTFVTS